MDYNNKNGLTPQALNKSIGKTIDTIKIINEDKMYRQLSENELAIAAESNSNYLTQEQIQQNIKTTQKQMEKAAKELDFIEAARLRDELFALQKLKK